MTFECAKRIDSVFEVLILIFHEERCDFISDNPDFILFTNAGKSKFLVEEVSAVSSALRWGIGIALDDKQVKHLFWRQRMNFDF